MTLGELLEVYNKGFYILSDGKHQLDIFDDTYKTYTVKSFSIYRYKEIRIVLENGDSVNNPKTNKI